jgi:hypothetical protein
MRYYCFESSDRYDTPTTSDQFSVIKIKINLECIKMIVIFFRLSLSAKKASRYSRSQEIRWYLLGQFSHSDGKCKIESSKVVMTRMHPIWKLLIIQWKFLKGTETMWPSELRMKCSEKLEVKWNEVKLMEMLKIFTHRWFFWGKKCWSWENWVIWGFLKNGDLIDWRNVDID